MVKNQILLSELTPDQLKDLIGVCVKGQLDDFKRYYSNVLDKDQLLSREETCKFLKIDLSTLWHWTNKGRVKAYSISSRRYYKKSELLEALKPLKK